MNDALRIRAIALYDRFTHGELDRRTFMAEITRLAGGAAAAAVLVAGIAADPVAAAVVAEDDERLDASYVVAEPEGGGGRPVRGYLVRQKEGDPRPAGVVVIHENRGLTAHIRDIARRMALEGFVAFAPDLLTPAGGTPADEDQARAMIAALDLAAATEDAVGAARWLARGRRSSGAVGAVGFCWGGAMVNRMAVAAGDALKAGVAYYGPAPEPAEAARVEAPLVLHYAGLDERVNKTAKPWVEALQAAGKTVTAYYYPGANHAFNNDTAADRYDPAAAKLAWERTTAFLIRELGRSE